MQFKTNDTEEVKTSISGMTVFNTEQVNTKNQPMFFGKPLGIQRYDSYKYPIFDKLTTQQLGYFWRPEEVSLQKDRGDYAQLRPEQKHIFTSNLKYQIMLDSVQGRAPGMAFAPYCSLPELEACMNVWQFMEMIHSRSYTYIIKNVYSNPSEVLDTILSDNRILAAKPINFFNRDKTLDQTSETSLAWRALTTGNIGGFDLWVEDAYGGTLKIETPLVKCGVPLEEIDLNDEIFDKSDILPRYLKIFRLPAENPHRRMTFKRTVDLKDSGDNPIFIRVTQEDGTLAWTSPIYIYR